MRKGLNMNISKKFMDIEKDVIPQTLAQNESEFECCNCKYLQECMVAFTSKAICIGDWKPMRLLIPRIADRVEQQIRERFQVKQLQYR